MRTTKLDGYSRVNASGLGRVDPLNGTRLRNRKNKRAKRKGKTQPIYKKRNSSKSQSSISDNLKNRSTLKGSTKRSRLEEKQRRYDKIQPLNANQTIHSGTGMSRVEGSGAGTTPNIGFSHVFVDNAPGSVLQGFSRYRPKELQGLDLQGIEILQGYQGATVEDLEDWDFLLSIEHPDVMQGFQAWNLDGPFKKKRKDRQAKRRAKRASKKVTRSAKKDKRSARKEAGKARRQREKEVRTAKKESRFLKKQQRQEQRVKNQEERRARKEQRITDRKERQRLRQETKRMRAELKAQSKAGLFDNIGDIAEGSMPFLSDLIGGQQDFEDFTISDFTADQIPFGFEDQISQYRDMPGDDVLDMRESDLDLMDDSIDDFVLDEETDDSKGGSMMLPLVAVGLLAASQMGKKKKKK